MQTTMLWVCGVFSTAIRWSPTRLTWPYLAIAAVASSSSACLKSGSAQALAMMLRAVVRADLGLVGLDDEVERLADRRSPSRSGWSPARARATASRRAPSRDRGGGRRRGDGDDRRDRGRPWEPAASIFSALCRWSAKADDPVSSRRGHDKKASDHDDGPSRCDCRPHRPPDRGDRPRRGVARAGRRADAVRRGACCATRSASARSGCRNR